MNKQQDNASDKNVLTPIVSEGSSNLNKSDKQDEKVDEKSSRLN